MQQPGPPYQAIAAQIRARITSGDLRPGDRVPSIRQIAQWWGVAIATVTKVTATLRAEGLVEAKVGSDTVVSAHGARERSISSPATNTVSQGTLRLQAPADRDSHRKRLLQSAIAAADTEGLEAGYAVAGSCHGSPAAGSRTPRGWTGTGGRASAPSRG